MILTDNEILLVLLLNYFSPLPHGQLFPTNLICPKLGGPEDLSTITRKPVDRSTPSDQRHVFCTFSFTPHSHAATQ